jgi:hypothetical protein
MEVCLADGSLFLITSTLPIAGDGPSAQLVCPSVRQDRPDCQRHIRTRESRSSQGLATRGQRRKTNYLKERYLTRDATMASATPADGLMLQNLGGMSPLPT